MTKHFSGNVKLYNEEFFINTTTGEGMPRLFKKIDPLLVKISKSIYISGYTFDDLKQELSIIVLEGLYSFDQTKGVKLSSFLHVHLHNKVISKIKQANKLTKHASTIKGDSEFPKVCECGCSVFYVKKLNAANEVESIQCDSCERIFRKNCRVSKKEFLFSELASVMPPDKSSGTNESTSGGSQNSILDRLDLEPVFPVGMLPSKRIEIQESIDSICENVDDKTATILRMIALEDCSIKEAAEEVGLSQWAANLRLKGLVKNKNVRDMLGK
jgi:RNA polymerase sigma factor (sigma-70 family)